MKETITAFISVPAVLSTVNAGGGGNQQNPVQNVPFINLAEILSLGVGKLGVAVSPAANVTLKTADAQGTSGFTGSTHWNPVGVPGPGTNYFTAANAIRTTNYNVNAGAVTVAFAGDSLSIDSGGRLIGKIGNSGSAGKASTGTNTFSGLTTISNGTMALSGIGLVKDSIVMSSTAALSSGNSAAGTLRHFNFRSVGIPS